MTFFSGLLMSFFVPSLLFLLPAAVECAPAPGHVVRVYVKTAEGLHEWTRVPSVPEGRGEASSKTYRLPDGNRVRLTMSRGDTEDLTVSLSTDSMEGIQALGAVLRCDRGDRFCGLLERVVDGGQGESWKPGMEEALDLRGQKVGMFVKPTVSLYAPFFIASSGYGVYVEGTWPGSFDMAATKDDEICFEFEGPQLVFHLLRGEPLEVIRKYGELVGMPILPPRWAFAPWRWRDEHRRRDEFFDGSPYSSYFNAEVVEDVLMMDALGIPCGVYWVDRPWAPGSRGYEGFEWDQIRLPHPREMIQWMESRDIRFLLWIAPWVLKQMAWDARDLGYAIEAHDNRRDMVLVDFTNPEARGWWYAYVKKVINDGVVGFKLDRAEEIVPFDLDTKSFSGKTMREIHNDYPHLYAKAVHDLLVRLRGDDFVVMPRAGYTGSQNYAIFWGGDTAGTEWGLRSAIIAVQRAAVMGFAVWGSDTGGYHQGYNRETMARWLAFSAFCPLMEVGPTDNRGLWNCPWQPGYDVELIAMWSLYARIHNRLGDYIYEYAKRAHETGEPIVRPLFVQYPDDPDAPWWWDEYMLGEDVLVCPVWRSGATSREVYLPSGEWVNPWEPGTVLQGPKRMEVECPLHVIPIYIREGAAVDIGDPNETYADAVERAKKRPNMAELIEKAGLQP